jgi:hypothetical protein
MLSLEEISGSITGIYKERISLNEPFVDFSARFANFPGTVALLSGGDLDCSRYHILGAKPWLSFWGRGRSMSIAGPVKSVEFEADPFDTLRDILNMYSGRPDQMLSCMPDPVVAGLFGYFSYDLKDCLECSREPQLMICISRISAFLLRQSLLYMTECLNRRIFIFRNGHYPAVTPWRKT